MKKNRRKNIDLFGGTWRLAPGGRELLDRIQSRTSQLSYELIGLSSLFRNLQSCEFTNEELYGLSLSLERIAKRLSKVTEKISDAAINEGDK